MFGSDEYYLGFMSLKILYMVNNDYYVLKNTETNKTFKVGEEKYKNLVKEGYNKELNYYIYDDFE